MMYVVENVTVCKLKRNDQLRRNCELQIVTFELLCAAKRRLNQAMRSRPLECRIR